jgi:hypothetical protein
MKKNADRIHSVNRASVLKPHIFLSTGVTSNKRNSVVLEAK